jgi:hypothetical protein
MLQKAFRFAGAAALLAASLLVTSAHESRVIGDQYEIAFGWQAEPAYAGLPNGPEVFITLAGSDDAHSHEESASDDHSHGEEKDNSEVRAVLEALDVQLMAEVRFGDETLTLALEPTFPYYTEYHGVGYVSVAAPLIPTLPGDYVFRIYGTINGIEVDETFDSANGEFSTVEPAEDLMFPSSQSLMARIASLEERLAALEALIAEMQPE